MRVPSFPTILRTIYTFSNATARRPNTFYKALSPFNRATILSMPTIPFLGSLFSSSNSTKMEYPVKKSDDEWQAFLNKGTESFAYLF
jgi:peptide-methionine (R)-S-oxide reductase